MFGLLKGKMPRTARELSHHGQTIRYHSQWNIAHWRADKNGVYHLIWDEQAIDRNILVDTGEQAILSAFFATGMANFGAPPANHYLALDSRASLAEADTLASLVELTKSGYARKALVSSGTGAAGQDFYINQPAAYYRADSKTVTWTAGEDWITAQKNINLVTDLTAVVDAASKHLIASLTLSTTRLLMNTDKLDGSMYIGLSE